MPVLNWTKIYTTANHNWQQKTAPGFFIASGGHTQKTPYPKVTSANGLRRAIINFMKWEGHHLEATNTQGRMVDKRKLQTDVLGRKFQVGNIEWQKGSGVVGSSDAKGHINITGHQYAVPLYVEIKYGKDRMSKEQKGYENIINKTGGIYIVVKDIYGFFDWYFEITKK